MGSGFWTTLPLVFVGVTLLGSVAFPALQTWRITQLLRENTDVLAPAQVLAAELQSGLGKELTTLQSYALSGDEAILEDYRATVANDERRIAELERLAPRFDEAAEDIHSVRRQIAAWHRVDAALLEQRGSRAEFAAALRAAQTGYDASLAAITGLASSLADGAAARDARVRALERRSIVANAALVFTALVAMIGVLMLTLRERRLSAALRQRVGEESDLRELARRLGAVMTRAAALRCVAEGARTVTRAAGAHVEWSISRNFVLESASAGAESAAVTCTRAPYAGSLSEAIAARGGPAPLAELGAAGDRIAARFGDVCGDDCTTLAVPLVSAGKVVGVLALVRDPAAPPFGEDEQRQLRLVCEFASSTLRRVDGVAAERRALRGARRRARQQTTLREAAEALAGAYTIDEVTQRMAHAAVMVMEGRGAFVERIDARSDETPGMITVEAVAGTGTPQLGATCPSGGSYAEAVMTDGKPMLVADLASGERSGIVATVAERGGSVIVVPIGGGGTPAGALCVVSSASRRFRSDDVTRAGIFGDLAALAFEKVRLLEEAHERRRVLERAVQSRSRLIRGFSHDVKNPVGAADGYAALLSLGIYGDLNAEQAASVDRIRRCIHDALSLINDLHELGRAETGNIALSPAPVDLADLVRSIGEEYGAAARGRGLSLTAEVALDDPTIETDQTRVRQILSNLLSNAIKYTESGWVLVRALYRSTGPFGDTGEWALVEVVDSGPGIPEHEQEFIFEEFSRLRAGDVPGAGLGLAISKLLAQALGGHISVQSELGHGSTFTLWLPARTGEIRRQVGAG